MTNRKSFIIIVIEFIAHLLQCGHGHRRITLSIKLKSVNNKNSQSAELTLCEEKSLEFVFERCGSLKLADAF